MFGETLETIMEIQAQQNQPEVLPKILIFLVDAILKLKGYKTEGIFRVPGDIEQVSDLRNRIEKGNFDLSGIKDPHVPSSLLKLWLRELAEPLIPTNKYALCISVGREEGESKQEHLRKAIAIIESLPGTFLKKLMNDRNQPECDLLCH